MHRLTMGLRCKRRDVKNELGDEHSYSSLNATIGSTLLALSAGIKQARPATTSKRTAVPPIAYPSIDPTPYSVDCIARPTR